jgi:hypothetical protein
MRFEPTIPTFKRGKTFHAKDRAATVTCAQDLDASYSSHLVPSLFSIFVSLVHNFTAVAVLEMLPFTFGSLING